MLTSSSFPHLVSAPWTRWIEQNEQALIDRLREAVEIPSVSGEASYRCAPSPPPLAPHPRRKRGADGLWLTALYTHSPHVHRMGQWLHDQLVKLGAE